MQGWFRKRLDRFRFGEHRSFRLGNPPRHIEIEAEALLRRDGYGMLGPDGQLSPLIAEQVDTTMADRVMRETWWILDETFHRSGLLGRWSPLRFLAMTQSSLEVNASTGQVTDARVPYFYIGLHAGLILHTADRLLRVMADPSALPSVGDIAKEEPGRTGALLEVVPRDEHRLMVALNLAMLATITVFAHEIGHVVRGHIWLLKSRYGISRLFEAGTDSGGGARSDRDVDRVRRAMELDADIFAGKTIGTMLLRERHGFMSVLGNDQRSLAQMLALAVTSAFRGFDYQEASNYYHTPFMRSQLVTSAARHEAIPEVSDDLEFFRNSAWVPERLGILRNPSDRLDNEAIHGDFESIRTTIASLSELDNELDTARAEMDDTFRKL
ncbi:MAG: hypothetical protein ABIK82_12640 [Pseudomonadota bacterium]